MDNYREEIIKYGKKMLESDLTSGTGGNISLRLPDKNWLAITPSGIPYDEIKKEQIIFLDIDTGEQVAGAGKASSEETMHRLIYQQRADMNALVHCHSVFATSYSCLGKTLPAVHYLIAAAGVDVPCAEYASFGSRELAENVLKAIAGRRACLMANHGLIAGGLNLPLAYGIAETIEYCCQIYAYAQNFGQPNILSDAEMEKMVQAFESYGS